MKTKAKRYFYAVVTYQVKGQTGIMSVTSKTNGCYFNRDNVADYVKNLKGATDAIVTFFCEMTAGEFADFDAPNETKKD